MSLFNSFWTLSSYNIKERTSEGFVMQWWAWTVLYNGISYVFPVRVSHRRDSCGRLVGWKWSPNHFVTHIYAAYLPVHTVETSTAPPFPRSSFSFSILEPVACLILKPRAPVSGGYLCHRHQRQQEKNMGVSPSLWESNSCQWVLVCSCSSPLYVHLPFLTTLGTSSAFSRVWDPDLTCHRFYNCSIKSLHSRYPQLRAILIPMGIWWSLEMFLIIMIEGRR